MPLYKVKPAHLILEPDHIQLESSTTLIFSKMKMTTSHNQDLVHTTIQKIRLPSKPVRFQSACNFSVRQWRGLVRQETTDMNQIPLVQELTKLTILSTITKNQIRLSTLVSHPPSSVSKTTTSKC